MTRLLELAKRIGLFACALGVATTVQAACIDDAGGPQIEKFETFKAAMLEGNFELAAAQVDMGGNRENEVVRGLNRLKLQGLEGFDRCVLLSRRVHSPNFTSEILYFTVGADVEYWLLLSAVQVDGEVSLTDVTLSDSYKRFREWLQ
ncbi:hypothetical protein C1J03_20850 [Sulfitobacter sp. SK012]|uniref:hypothetical protein n=1 Tax=Sulfitobacter sp. SK012 TaxID=1389005 RepID=UPI000E0ABA33|nr:hypothetical protein [Sulfitobacter sp. SK012]AXI48225.1 hypothetical protein C1J03_20850 [Sulfitobacter sp. SK012]